MILLGSTGSIGVNTLKVAIRFSLHVEALVAGTNVKLLNEQIKKHNPKYVCVATKEFVKEVEHKNVYYGNEGILEILEIASSNLVVNALVGFAGLAPTLKTMELGKKLALANKESLVVAGHLLNCKEITPIDSEHFGLWYLLNGREIESMTIMASGGAFRDTPLDELALQTPAQALKHPNWSMGRKITIDSATMTNKLFELLEAKWLFGIDKLDAIMETKSLMHAMINFKDGSSTTHMANADMKLPISYALLGKVDEQILPPVDLCKAGSLEFRKITQERYPIWEIKDEILKEPHRGVVINAANEIAINKFFAGQLNILELAEFTKKAFRYFENINPKSLNEIFEIDKEVRVYCNK
ncbi:1-deoxy-D-xylulose-5-phosphate reductoisomerase [Sulfurospirillum arcachonense]|uniref:1-deoxy-D-xylulose-5-phosphate reductoisomerase n=1 Tax=Sulfurospirillum arcachonense TaxID=57666 RepID=UPI0004691E3B|nr:1-deoxy-D-xylulose-5-phosphate reductoisomerase [Sulfurospirillum arcachonense]